MKHERPEIVRVVDALRSIVQSLRISGRLVEQQVGISSAQLYILEELAERPAQSINELAERTFTHQSSVSMVVREASAFSKLATIKPIHPNVYEPA